MKQNDLIYVMFLEELFFSMVQWVMQAHRDGLLGNKDNLVIM